MQSFSRPFGEEALKFETGRLAGLADGAVVMHYGETVVLATVVIGKEPREGVDFFPLLVDYEERLYAAGKISGSRWVKREGRPSENAILTARLIDRPIRPLFPKTYRRDVQIIVTILAYDGVHDPDVLSINAASAALLLTHAPFGGPIAAARVGRLDDQFVLNPTVSQQAASDLDLVVVGTPDRVMMLEAGAKQLPEELIEEAIAFAQGQFGEILALQHELADAVRKEPRVTPEETALLPEIQEKIREHLGGGLRTAIRTIDKDRRRQDLDAFEAQILTSLEGQYKQIDIRTAFGKLVDTEIRQAILHDDLRPDGRKIDEVRPLSIDVNILPRVHGSALFSRGETQALSIVTLGAPGEHQWIETMEQEGVKRFMHHYNFPPFSVGDVSPLRGASRREIGHGALAERALAQVIPEKEVFPYTIRVVSEVLTSNGSTSMASTCGAMLALMDAGVPVTDIVAGIAMGLMTERTPSETPGTPSQIKKFKVLTDLQGLEDFAGDMDFKIAGTATGVTAIQLDIKIDGLTTEIIHETLLAARKARLFILDEMKKVLATPRADLSPHAPRILTIKIDPDKIGELIGPGGKTINKIIEEAGGRELVSIDIEDDGMVMISATDVEAGKKALALVEQLTKSLEVGELYTGTVTSIQKNRLTGQEIGAIVQITPYHDGMVHVSEIAEERIPDVSSVLKVGDQIPVVIKEIDKERGRISLSHKAAKRRLNQTGTAANKG